MIPYMFSILNGLKIKNDANPYGDIEILITGLRPGEKLYEELLINAKSKPTSIGPNSTGFLPKIVYLPFMKPFSTDSKIKLFFSANRNLNKFSTL